MTRSPRLVLVREPDQLGVERAHPQLAFGVWLVELTEPNRHVAADDDWTPAGLDDDHLRPACVARRRDEPEQLNCRAACLRAAQAARPLQPVLASHTTQGSNEPA